MARLSLKLAGYPWDHITPLLTGEVIPQGNAHGPCAKEFTPLDHESRSAG